MFFIFVSISDWYKTQEMCDINDSEDSFSIMLLINIRQKMCDKAFADSLATWKLILDWFVASKMIKELFTTLYADENILYFNEDSSNVAFSCNEIGVLNIDLCDINLDHRICEDDPDTIIHIRHIGILNLKNANTTHILWRHVYDKHVYFDKVHFHNMLQDKWTACYMTLISVISVSWQTQVL